MTQVLRPKSILLRASLLLFLVACASLAGAQYNGLPFPSTLTWPFAPVVRGVRHRALLGVDGVPAAAVPAACPPAGCTPGRDVGHDFFVQVVARLTDVPMTGFAVDALVAWEPHENTLACWNPLATTWRMDEVCNFNSIGVQHYQDQNMGVQATANTLSLAYYNAIRAMLRLESFDREGLRGALSTWGTCSGSGCDPLLDTWWLLWNSSGGECCGCLPANCCPSA
jgi:hypothetical protein